MYPLLCVVNGQFLLTGFCICFRYNFKAPGALKRKISTGNANSESPGTSCLTPTKPPSLQPKLATSTPKDKTTDRNSKARETCSQSLSNFKIPKIANPSSRMNISSDDDIQFVAERSLQATSITNLKVVTVSEQLLTATGIICDVAIELIFPVVLT